MGALWHQKMSRCRGGDIGGRCCRWRYCKENVDGKGCRKEAAVHWHGEQEMWRSCNFWLHSFCNNSLQDSCKQQHSDNIHCVFISRYRYYIYAIILKFLNTVIHTIIKFEWIITIYLCRNYDEMTNIHWWHQCLLMTMTFDIKRDKNKNFKEGIQLVYVRMNGMWLVFTNKKLHMVYDWVKMQIGIQLVYKSHWKILTSKIMV